MACLTPVSIRVTKEQEKKYKKKTQRAGGSSNNDGTLYESSSTESSELQDHQERLEIEANNNSSLPVNFNAAKVLVALANSAGSL